MDNLSDDVLKEKSVHANKLEWFVFMPNELNQIKPDSRVKNDAIAAKNAGNIHFQNKRYDDAIRMYDMAIEKYESYENLCDLELAVCYQNRAAAKMHVKNLFEAISDASKAIELNEHYSKAYYRRAMIYNQLKKCYRALQDVVQGCILERFKNKTYNAMVGVLLTQIDSKPAEIQWKMAYSEMEADELHCDHCLQNQINVIIKSGILDLISVPIPNEQPHVGYVKAMIGLKESSVDKIMAGCKEEEAMKGEHLAESFIVRAYMNTVAIASPLNLSREYPKDLRRMNELIWDGKTSENIKFNALLCRANMYNRQYNFKEADRELKSLEERYQNHPLVYLIKSGALMQFSQSKPEFLEALTKCCALIPNVYELHLQQAMAEIANSRNRLFPTADPLTKMEGLINRFPNEIEPRLCQAVIYAKLNEPQKAKKILKKIEKEFPNRTVELSSAYGMLKPTHSSCVAYFKRSLKFNKDDPGSLKGLLNYYDSTYEYAKAIEVSTRALYSFLEVSDFKQMFEHRHALLKRIVSQDYWDRL